MKFLAKLSFFIDNKYRCPKRILNFSWKHMLFANKIIKQSLSMRMILLSDDDDFVPS